MECPRRRVDLNRTAHPILDDGGTTGNSVILSPACYSGTLGKSHGFEPHDVAASGIRPRSVTTWPESGRSVRHLHRKSKICAPRGDLDQVLNRPSLRSRQTLSTSAFKPGAASHWRAATRCFTRSAARVTVRERMLASTARL